VPGAGQRPLRVLEERVERKRQIFEHYKDALGNLPGIEFMPEAFYGKSNRWLGVMLITPDEFGADRAQVRLALEAENIEARPLWKPMHMQRVFDVLGYTAQGTRYTGKARNPARVVGGEVAEDLFNRGLCLPSGTAMTDSDLDRIISIILKCRR
jgi:dTDP-4-amino-4,6-dideoxygalactose transaminase